MYIYGNYLYPSSFLFHNNYTFTWKFNWYCISCDLPLPKYLLTGNKWVALTLSSIPLMVQGTRTGIDKSWEDVLTDIP